MNKIYIVLSIAFLTVFLIRILKRAFRLHYFSLNQLVIDKYNEISIQGLFIIYGPTFIGGFIVSVIARSQSKELVVFYGLMTSILIVWPVILYSSSLLEEEAYSKIKTVYYIYGLYSISQVLVALWGSLMYGILVNDVISNNLYVNKLLDYYDSIHSLFQALIASSIFAFLIWVTRKVMTYLKEKIYGAIQ